MQDRPCRTYLMQESSVSDHDLMQQAARGDHAAFGTLTARYQERVYRLAMRYVGDQDLARDIVQEVFLRVYRAAPRYHPQASFFTWLYRIAVNYCLNQIRRTRSDPLGGQMRDAQVDDVGQITPAVQDRADQRIEQQERARAVRAALDQLPKRQRMAVLLVRFEELSYRQAAAVLNCSEGALESLLQRAMKLLRQRLAQFS